MMEKKKRKAYRACLVSVRVGLGVAVKPCLLGVKNEMGRVELLGYIEKKGSRAIGLITNEK